MNIDIQDDRKNPLLKRREVRFTVSYSAGTPDRAAVRKELVSKLSSKEKLTVLDYVKPHFGKHEAEGYVKVYDDDESLAVEPAYKLERNFAAPEEKEESAEPAVAAGEQPQEGGAEDIAEKEKVSEQPAGGAKKEEASDKAKGEESPKEKAQEAADEKEEKADDDAKGGD